MSPSSSKAGTNDGERGNNIDGDGIDDADVAGVTDVVHGDADGSNDDAICGVEKSAMSESTLKMGVPSGS
jgi:hypothetical protein